MRVTSKRKSVLLTLALTASSLVAVANASDVATTVSAPAGTVTICTDLTTHLQVVLHADKKSCNFNQATTIFHPEKVDSPLHVGPGFANLRICTDPHISAHLYQQIRTSCAKFQKATDYYRAISAPGTPRISSTLASTYDGAILSITQDEGVTDSPIAYYVITNLTTGSTTRVSKAALGSVTHIHILDLSPKTQYTFTIAAVSADGTSTSSSASAVITTFAAPVALPAFTLSSAGESRVANSPASGFTTSSTGGAIASFAISPAAPSGMSFNTTTGAFSGTPTSVAGATAYTVTATNASGSASATFTFTVTTSLTAPAFTLSSSSESRIVNIAATGFTVSSTGGAIASFAISPAAPSGMTFNTTTGAFTGTPTSVASATVYTVTATNASGSASATFTFTVIVATCATGGTCVVGDTGPGGGFVFYYLAAGFSCGANFAATGSPTGGLCHYLEVASTTGTVHWTDDVITWAVAAQNTNDVTSVTNDGAAYLNSLGVGLGYQNSLAIVAQGNDSTSAAGAARAYAGGSKSDWYLPSAAELNLLCQWGRGTAPDVTTACSFSGSLNSATYGAASAALISNMYWSSSEGDASNAWQQDFGGVTRVNLRSKAGVNWVRPVRAF